MDASLIVILVIVAVVLVSAGVMTRRGRGRADRSSNTVDPSITKEQGTGFGHSRFWH